MSPAVTMLTVTRLAGGGGWGSKLVSPGVGLKSVSDGSGISVAPGEALSVASGVAVAARTVDSGDGDGVGVVLPQAQTAIATRPMAANLVRPLSRGSILREPALESARRGRNRLGGGDTAGAIANLRDAAVEALRLLLRGFGV
jgi:hypothetical protein